MPFFILLVPIIPLLATIPIELKEQEKEKQVNEICIKNYKKPEELKVCKDILLNRRIR